MKVFIMKEKCKSFFVSFKSRFNAAKVSVLTVLVAVLGSAMATDSATIEQKIGIRQVPHLEIAACIKGGKTDCTCYSHQATPLREITKAMCLDYAENGLPFDSFREPVQEISYQSQQQTE